MTRISWLQTPSSLSAVLALLLTGSPGLLWAQETQQEPPLELPQELPAEEPAAAQAGQAEPVPAPVAAKLSMQDCIDLAFHRQPALAAARASLAAAESGQRGVNSIVLGRLFAPDLPVRREQACHGVAAATAALIQAEWETRYAVRRTFYSIQYAKMQKALIDGALAKIDDTSEKAKKLIDIGDPNYKVTTIDLKILAVNKEMLKTKQAAAAVGIDKAIAGLREAIGLGPDDPLLVADEPLPAMVVELNQRELIASALYNRPEIAQANAMNRVAELEIDAQRRVLFSPQVPTFAAGADIHAKPIPQGYSNGEYRPGAIGPEMPVFMIGHRSTRIQRAADLNDRAIAVVDKTQNLIALEVQATLLKWLEAAQNVRNLAGAPKMAMDVATDTQGRFNDGKVSGEDYLRARTLQDQAQGLYNEALFNHALALAALERVTAGGYLVPAK